MGKAGLDGDVSGVPGSGAALFADFGREIDEAVGVLGSDVIKAEVVPLEGFFPALGVAEKFVGAESGPSGEEKPGEPMGMAGEGMIEAGVVFGRGEDADRGGEDADFRGALWGGEGVGEVPGFAGPSEEGDEGDALIFPVPGGS